MYSASFSDLSILGSRRLCAGLLISAALIALSGNPCLADDGAAPVEITPNVLKSDTRHPPDGRADGLESPRSKLRRQGLSVTLIVTKSNVTATAKKYAFGRDYRLVERYLLSELGSSTSVKVPLERIVQPFVRKVLNSDASCNGPNCFNAALNSNRGRKFTIKKESAQDLLNEVHSQYRYVQPYEALQPGDLLVYRSVGGPIEHASAYMGDNIVFTKNGMSSDSPYVFQTIETNESFYFPNGDFELTVFRVGGYSRGIKVIYREGPAPVLREQCLQHFLEGA